MRRLIASAIAAAVLLVPSLRANADELTAATTVDTFSSTGDVYGPWQTELLEYQWQAGRKDIPSVTLLNRNDHDRNIFGQAIPSRSTAVYVDDYHNWTSSFFTYVQLMTSDGTILPNRLFYAEADAKLGAQKNVVFGVGASAYANPDHSSTRSLSIGPTYYAKSMVYTIRYLPSAVGGDFSGLRNGFPVIGTTKAYGSGMEFIAEYNRLGTNQVIVAYLGGNQPGILVGGLGAVPTQFTNIQRIGEFDLSIKHWVSRDFGFILGGSVGSHAMQTSGAKIYDVQSVTAGLFFGRAVGLPR
ncbi:MAG TPA: hypothetical protein VFN49_10965 [Candidatus Aquilonibacter sp.]|nr:hypothetical protein [Candidatus Aquilonibacter sp.]